MLNRKLSVREKTMLLIFTFLLIIALYYLVIYEPTGIIIDDATTRLMDVENETEIEMIRAAQLRNMKTELETLRAQNTSDQELPEYDNLENIFLLLGEIFGSKRNTTAYSEPVIDGNIARRNLNMSFTCDSFAEMKAIMAKLSDIKYRCSINTMSVSSSPDGSQSVSLAITFYEYVASDIQ